MNPLRLLLTLCACLVFAAGAGYGIAQMLSAPAAPPSPPVADSWVDDVTAVVPGSPNPVDATPEPDEWTSMWVDRNNAAADLLRQGDLEGALEIFERCVEAEPYNETFRNNLAETLVRLAGRARERDGDLETALAHLERAMELSDREDLREYHASWSVEAEVEESFLARSTAHFEIVYDEALRGLSSSDGIALLGPLESAYSDFYQLYNMELVDGDTKVRVVVYSPEDFDRVTGLGEWAGGVFDGTIRLPLRDVAGGTRSVERVLRHELSHAFTREAGGRTVPGWLNEGLAQLLEGDTTVAVTRAREELAGQRLFDLEQLRGTLTTWTDTNEIRRAYAQSLALAAYVDENLGFGASGDPLLIAMVKGCQSGSTCAEVFQREIGYPLDVMLDDFATSVGATR